MGFADFGRPCSRYDVADIIHVYVESLSPERQDKLLSVNMYPGRDFLRAFMRRHKNVIRFGLPANEAEIRWRSCDTETLTTHLAMFESYLEKYKIDDTRLYNIDETGVTPNRDAARRRAYKLTLRSSRAAQSQVRVATFKYTDRITMLGAVCADGTCHTPTFVITSAKGSLSRSMLTLLPGTELPRCFFNIILVVAG